METRASDIFGGSGACQEENGHTDLDQVPPTLEAWERAEEDASWGPMPRPILWVTVSLASKIGGGLILMMS